jgi:DNA-binding CsgD family transcriptional regulator
VSGFAGRVGPTRVEVEANGGGRLKFDPIALIERAYEHRPDPSSWLQATTESVVQAVEPTCLAAMSYVIGSRGPEAPVAALATQALGLPEIQRMVSIGWATSSPEDAQAVMAACRKPGITSLRQILGARSIDRWLSRCLDRPPALVDAVGVLLMGPAGKPLLLSMACARERVLSDLEQTLWHRVAIHLSAGFRLAGRANESEAEDVEAILTPESRVAHARGAGATAQGRELLQQACKDIDRARSRRGRSDPFAALSLWQGLLAGRWSLVEHFDSDGRRFVLARRNDQGLPHPAALTRRQRQVVFLVSLGLSNKETAYALGLAENTISAHLTTGLLRLGIQSRAALIRISGGIAQGAATALNG